MINETTLSSEKRELLNRILARKGIATAADQTIPRRTKSGPYPLSFAQTRLWILDQLESGATYNMPDAYRLGGRLDVRLLEQSLNEIVQRHEVLRTTFRLVDGQPLQDIAPSLSLNILVNDLRGLPEAERESKVQQQVVKEARRPFDLGKGPLLRATLLRLDNEEHIFLLVVPHIIFDGWSRGVFRRELAGLYRAFYHKDPSPPPVLPIQYADFAIWQRRWLQGEVLESQLDYWRQELQGAPPDLKLPTDYPRPAVNAYRGAKQTLTLSKRLTEALKKLNQKEGATMYMTLLASFNLLLYQYSDQGDIVVGSPISNRNRVEIEDLIGFFANTMVMRTDLSGNPTFLDLLGRVREKTLQAYAHQDLPFEKLVEELRPERKLNHQPLFQVMFVLQNAPMATPELPGLALTRVQVDTKTAKFDMILNIREEEGCLICLFEYNTDLFEETTIKQKLEHFKTLLETIVSAPEKRLCEMPRPPQRKRQHPRSNKDMKFHHVGCACRDMQAGIRHVKKNYMVTDISDIVFDELQDASVCLIQTDNDINIELISGPQVESLLDRGVSQYHLCYEVADIFTSIESLKKDGATLVAEPKPAVLFNDRLVAFLETNLGLIELVEITKTEISEKLPKQFPTSKQQKKTQTLAITATFTAEPIEEPLTFWMQELDLSLKVEFAQYNQVFQQLLDPSSLLCRNDQGINVVLVNFEDWQKYEDGSNGGNDPRHTSISKIEQHVQELVTALRFAAERSSAAYLVCLCPPSPATLADPKLADKLRHLEKRVSSELNGVTGLYVITSTELNATYAVSDYFDPHGYTEGHIPYTPAFFSALGTMMARKIHALRRAPYKVIVLDCDGTLWKGVCGEDGASGVEINVAYKHLQEFMVMQRDAGMLICLCSKNSPEDVFQVFEQRPEMPLKREHLASWRINWISKPENLQSLADELQLGLDSFIFIDDNPIECAQVQSTYPEVLTVQLPEDLDEIPRFLNHIWAFDHLKVTKEDEQRAELYRQNIERERSRKETPSFTDFLKKLDLKLKLSEMEPNQLARVSQLTQRTNQFNFTTVRRSESEIQSLCESEGLECLVAEVSDRFGDYGLVGVMMFKSDEKALTVDTFLLSCRALGRGVEHKMFAKLGETAINRGHGHVDVSYVPTEKNKPALDFLNGVGSKFKKKVNQHSSLKFPAEFLRKLRFSPDSAQQASTKDPRKSGTNPTVSSQVQPKSELLGRIATELFGADQILNLIKSQNRRNRPELQGTFVAPQTHTEKLLTGFWREVLGIDRVGIHDNFFDLGGHSMQAVQLTSKASNALNVDLSLRFLFIHPTIADFARALDGLNPDGHPTSGHQGHPSSSENLEKPAEEFFESQPSPFLKIERRPLLSLYATKKTAPVDAAALVCMPKQLLENAAFGRDEMIQVWGDNLPTLSTILETPMGRIGLIRLPRFGSELHNDHQEELLEVITDALELSKELGAGTISLTGMIPSATDYGRAITKAIGDRDDLPVVSNGHVTTVTAVVLSIKRILEEGGRDLTNERVGFLGLDYIGRAVLRLMLKFLPHPAEITLCDLYGKRDGLEKIRQELESELGFKGSVQIIEPQAELASEFYNASLIIGAINIPDVLDIPRMNPGTMIVEYSVPHCFSVQSAIERLQESQDILFTEGGALRAPDPTSQLRYLPRSAEGMMSSSHKEVFLNYNPYHIMACVFSSLLYSRYKHLEPAVGALKDTSCSQHYELLNELGFQAPELHCEGYTLAEQSIQTFRSRFGADRKVRH